MMLIEVFVLMIIIEQGDKPHIHDMCALLEIPLADGLHIVAHLFLRQYVDGRMMATDKARELFCVVSPAEAFSNAIVKEMNDRNLYN